MLIFLLIMYVDYSFWILYVENKRLPSYMSMFCLCWQFLPFLYSRIFCLKLECLHLRKDGWRTGWQFLSSSLMKSFLAHWGNQLIVWKFLALVLSALWWKFLENNCIMGSKTFIFLFINANTSFLGMSAFPIFASEQDL